MRSIPKTNKEMLSRLEYLKTVRGIGVFTARPGMGKTYALRCFMNGLNPNQYQTAYISLSTISVTEFYREFCTLLGLEGSGNKTDVPGHSGAGVLPLQGEETAPGAGHR